jgi:hypothetical protein
VYIGRQIRQAAGKLGISGTTTTAIRLDCQHRTRKIHGNACDMAAKRRLDETLPPDNEQDAQQAPAGGTASATSRRASAGTENYPRKRIAIAVSLF